MAKTTDFGKAVKIRLVEIGKTQVWLIKEVRERTGMYFDEGYLWKILSGDRPAAAIVRVIREILDMEEVSA